MKRVFTAVLIAAAAVSISAAEWDVTARGQQQAARADVEGTWSGRVRTQEKADGTREPRLDLQMQVDDERNWRSGSNWGQTIPLSAFSNLPANLDGPQDVAFELRREAGVIRFQGRFESGRGVGHLFFTANRDFARVMEKQTRETFRDRDLFTFAILDVSRAFVAELQALGFKDVTLDDARKLRIHGTTTDFIRGIRSAGYADVSLDQVLKLRIHGVTPQFIANLKAEGLQNPSLDEVLKFRIHGVTSVYVKEMRAAGLGSNLDDILQLRIHGVTTAYAREMRDIAGREMDARDLKTLKIHGVTPTYVKEMREAGFNESLDSLRQARIHGVTPAFAKEMTALGYKDLDVDDLRTFRIHGVTAKYVRDMAALGYKNVAPRTLVKFRIHGITPSFVQELKDAGYENLAEDELVDWAIHGRRLLKYRRK